MTKPVPTPATYADLEKVPPHLVAEIIHGVLETHPRPVGRHGAAQATLQGELHSPYRKGSGGPGGWIFISEPELHLGSHVLVPDIAGWKRERLPDVPKTPGITVPPDWVCEVLSPATAKRDRGAKQMIYAEFGISHFWVVDPSNRLIDAYQLVAGKWMLLGSVGGSDEVSLPPFEAARFPLDLLFPFDQTSEE
jgi:Uma2 family endonuclease